MMERYRPRRRPMATWNPLREMEEMERMMEETFGRPMMWRRSPEEEMIWSPSIEMYEKGNTYIIRMELPGVSPENVDISMSGDTLTVKGERKPPEDIKDEEYQLCETCYGSFTRSISLPEMVNSDKIEANFENGILDIRLPKAEEIKPKQIKLQGKQSQSQSKMQSEGAQSSMSSGESRGTESRGSSQTGSNDSESVADSARSVSEREQQEKSKIPYEG